MASTILDIYNRAISAVHGRGRLASLSTNTKEKQECDIWYYQVRDVVQEAAHWDCCRNTSRLTLLETRDPALDWQAGMPDTQYLYRYALPTEYLRAWNLVDFSYFSISYDGTRDRMVLDTNAKNAVLIFGQRQSNPAHWSPGQVSATVHGLAASIVGGVGGTRTMTQMQYQLANDILIKAQVSNSNNSTFIAETIPQTLTARGYSEATETRYYYPYGEVFSAAAPNA